MSGIAGIIHFDGRPVEPGLIGIMADARRRFLKHDGRLIPAQLRLQLGAVESDKCRQLAEGWQASRIPDEYHWLRQYGINIKHAVNLQADEVLADPAELACIDLQADNPDFSRGPWNSP